MLLGQIFTVVNGPILRKDLAIWSHWRPFFKWANPGLFFTYFRLFKHITIFTTNKCEKMSVQYTVPGFEVMTFET